MSILIPFANLYTYVKRASKIYLGDKEFYVAEHNCYWAMKNIGAIKPFNKFL